MEVGDLYLQCKYKSHMQILHTVKCSTSLISKLDVEKIGTLRFVEIHFVQLISLLHFVE